MPRTVTLYTDDGNLSVKARRYLTANKVAFDEVNVAKQCDTPITVSLERIPLLVVKGSRRVSTVFGFDEFRYASALDPKISYEKWVAQHGKIDNPS